MSGGGVAFNIGSQQAGAIYQAAGNQTIEHGDGTLTVAALGAVSDVRGALDSAGVSGPARREAEEALETVETELEGGAPDKGRIAAGVERAVGILDRAGVLAQAGESLASPLRSLASFAGVAGVAALRLLG